MSVDAIVSKAKTFYNENQKLVLAVGGVAGGAVLLKTASLVYSAYRKSSVNEAFRNLEEDIVHLYVFPRWSHGPSFFPHCLKVETFLRLAKIPYVVHFTTDSSLSPNGKLPFIVHNKTVLADGEFILQYLTEKFDVRLDESLTPAEQARGLMIRRMVETSFNYGLNRTTFVDFPKYMADMFSKEYALEPVMARFMVSGMRQATITVLNANGYGDLNNEQYETEFLRDMQSLDTFLSKKPFLFGNSPTSYDCSVYAWLQIAGEMGANGSALSYLTSSKVLKDYINRVTRLAYPDMDGLQTAYETQKFIP